MRASRSEMLCFCWASRTESHSTPFSTSGRGSRAESSYASFYFVWPRWL